MWVAIAAVAFTSVARAEAGRQTVKGYTHPVLEFLARSQSHTSVASSGVLRFSQLSSRRQSGSMRDAASGALIAMLPVLFIGLVSPLTLVSSISVGCLGRAPAAPLLAALYQRPPPRLA
jgi:hypothetical protein